MKSVLDSEGTVKFLPEDLTNLYTEAELLSMKDKHSGQRAFIIGNGPSLKETDLSKMSGELTFASNDFRLLFHKLTPTYWVVEDAMYISEYSKEIDGYKGEKLISVWSKHHQFGSTILDEESVTYFMPDGSWWYRYGLMLFANRLDRGIISSCGTVTFSMMQLAYLLGSREIYLVGVDHTLPEGYGETNHFTEDYCVKLSKHHGALIDLQAKRPFVRINAGYKAAREFADEQGIIIRNATHGGKLEAFERVDYSSLF